MGLLKFDKLPFNTLVGADTKTFRQVMQGTVIDKEYRGKFRLTKFCRSILQLFYRKNTKCYERMEKKPIKEPVFIIGHWRSGTTFVHNVISCDPQFGYCTTYQTVFPHLMLYASRFFKWCASVLMPSTRPTDSLELSVEQPQEEEFALANMTHMSFYHFWLFPRRFAEWREKALLLQSASREEYDEFCQTTRKMISISLHCQQKERFLSKNPPHTARVKALLETYPDAKFIHIVRNPYTVFESTRNFFTNTIRPLQLQNISPEELEQEILTTYTALHNKYEAEKGLIPEGNLIEIRFEDFEADPMGVTEQIYSKLKLGSFDEAKQYMGRYVNSKRGFRKNKYDYDSRTIDLVNSHWGYAVEQWNYEKL